MIQPWPNKIISLAVTPLPDHMDRFVYFAAGVNIFLQNYSKMFDSKGALKLLLILLYKNKGSQLAFGSPRTIILKN